MRENFRVGYRFVESPFSILNQTRLPSVAVDGSYAGLRDYLYAALLFYWPMMT